MITARSERLYEDDPYASTQAQAKELLRFGVEPTELPPNGEEIAEFGKSQHDFVEQDPAVVAYGIGKPVALTAVTDGLKGRLRHAVCGLTPGYFALVMASGIISVGMAPPGRTRLSDLLLCLCRAAFVVLLALDRCGASSAIGVPPPRTSLSTPPRVPAFSPSWLAPMSSACGWRMDGHLHRHRPSSSPPPATVWLVLGYVVPVDGAARPAGTTGGRPPPTARGSSRWSRASRSLSPRRLAGAARAVWRTRCPRLAGGVSWSVGVFFYAAAGSLCRPRLMLYEFGPRS